LEGSGGLGRLGIWKIRDQGGCGSGWLRILVLFYEIGDLED